MDAGRVGGRDRHADLAAQRPARDFNALRNAMPTGIQVARENVERAVATGQEIYDLTAKTNEAITQIAKGEMEQVAAKAQAQAEKVVKTAAKKARS